MTHLLPSYIRAHRKQRQLSQGELAFLLGFSSQSGVSQHESLARLPQLKVLLKYEALFGGPIGGLYPKLHAEAVAELRVQLRLLRKDLNRQGGAAAARKLQSLAKLTLRVGTRL